MPNRHAVRRAALAISLAAAVSLAHAQSLEQPVKVKGGHQLGETAQQFFAEGKEKDLVAACQAGEYKKVSGANRRAAKQLCAELAVTRQQAMGGKRTQYEGAGAADEERTDSFVFDGGHLVQARLTYAAPSPESSGRGLSFDQILAGIEQVYGRPTTEHSHPARNVYGVESTVHSDIWLGSATAILVSNELSTEAPSTNSTTVNVFTRGEYDRMMVDGLPRGTNPVQ